MIIYFLLALFSSIFMYLGNKKNKKIFFLLSFLSVFLVSALRYGIGYDYLRIYVPIFNNVISSDSFWVNNNGDYFNVLLMKMIGLFSKDSFYYFVITSFIICFLFFKTIKDQTAVPWFSLILFIISGCYIESFNAIRQYIAIAVFVYSFVYIEEKNLLKYIMCIGIASMFHNSAIILLPLYFVFNIKFTGWSKIFIFFACAVFFVLGDNIINYIISLTKYAVYFERSEYSVINPAYSEIIISSIIFLIATYFYKKNNKKNEKFEMFYKYLILYFIVSIFSFKIILAYRLIMYFKVSVIFILPEMLNIMKCFKNKLIFSLFIMLFFGMITYFGGYFFEWYDMKYRSVFNK